LTYELGSPLIKQAKLNLENGKTFTVRATNQSPDHVYVSKVLLNGTPLKRHHITHEEIMGGGVLEFVMSKKPR